MNWSRTKLIFIVAFLVLDLFLGTQLYQKQKNADQIQSLPNGPSSEEQLKENEIGLPPDLPDVDKATFVKGEPETFVNDKGDLSSGLKKLAVNSKDKDIQKFSVHSGGHALSSTLKKPLDLPKSEDFGTLLQKYVYKGSQYRYWKAGEASGSLTFVQTFNDRPVFSKDKSQTGSLRVKTKDDKITGYKQTYLNLKSYGDDKEILKPIKAAEKLLRDNDLTFGDTVTHIELGYLNLTQEDSDELKVFIPVWYIQVEGDEEEPDDEYFVNALTGEVQTLEEQDEDMG